MQLRLRLISPIFAALWIAAHASVQTPAENACSCGPGVDEPGFLWAGSEPIGPEEDSVASSIELWT